MILPALPQAGGIKLQEKPKLKRGVKSFLQSRKLEPQVRGPSDVELNKLRVDLINQKDETISTEYAMVSPIGR
jgi:hypothetical protein